MPITQSRFIRIISAAHAALARLKRIESLHSDQATLPLYLRELAERISDPQAKALVHQAIGLIHDTQAVLRTDAIVFGEMVGHVAREREYFLSAQARNERAQAKQRLRRAQAASPASPPTVAIGPRSEPPEPAPHADWQPHWHAQERRQTELKKREQRGALTLEELEEMAQRQAREASAARPELMHPAGATYDTSVIKTSLPSAEELYNEPDFDGDPL